MTIEEANAKAKILADINLKIWDTSDKYEKGKLRSYFKQCYKNIIASGFKVIRSKVYDPTRKYKVHSFKIRNDKSEDLVNIVDNRDPNGYHKGDCTTRCISFCTGVDYMTIQKEQFANAKAYGAYGVTWRTPKIWSMSLMSRGYRRVDLPRHMSAKVFLRKLDNWHLPGMIAAVSAHHIAAIDMTSRKILDIWNSSGCRIKYIYVPEAQKDAWEKVMMCI